MVTEELHFCTVLTSAPSDTNKHCTADLLCRRHNRCGYTELPFHNKLTVFQDQDQILLVWDRSIKSKVTDRITNFGTSPENHTKFKIITKSNWLLALTQFHKNPSTTFCANLFADKTYTHRIAERKPKKTHNLLLRAGITFSFWWFATTCCTSTTIRLPTTTSI